MANARIIQNRDLQLDFVVQKDKSVTRISDGKRNVSIADMSPFSKNFTEKDYASVRINDIKTNTLIKENLPFRVRFTNKNFSAYSPENPPPIGVAVIGYNNYIL